MTRFLEEALLFFLPFAAFAIYLVTRRRNPFHWASWSSQASWLLISGLSLVILTLLGTFLLADRERGAFVPAHMENGRLVPGQFK